MTQATKLTAIEQLRRATLSTFLWEGNYTEEGKPIAERIQTLVKDCTPQEVANLAIEAREQMHLRSIPLLLIREIARRPNNGVVAATLPQIIQRPDEIHKFVELYWKDGKVPLSAQVKKGLAAAFEKFNAYSFAKYRKGDKVSLRDVMFMTHPEPKTSTGKQTKFERRENKDLALTPDEMLFKQIAEDTLPTPDTWEVALSAGEDKKEAFERLLKDGKLGYMALIRNLRNMAGAGVRMDLVADAIMARRGADQLLPFRFFTAAQHASQYRTFLEEAFIEQMKELPKLSGRSLIIVDVSGSMGSLISGQTTVSRAIAASSLAAIAREVCEESVIYATAGSDLNRTHKTKLVPQSRGMTLAEDIWKMCHPLGGGGIFLNQVTRYLQNQNLGKFDRVIVLTDEADMGRGEDSAEKSPVLCDRNYIMNVAANAQGIGYGKWTKINGFSENVLKYVHELEASEKRQ
jgi:60 kDa SS-A/Ro ribonucleoprotein